MKHIIEKNIIGKIFYLLGSNKKKLPYLFSLFVISSFLDFLGIGLIWPFIGMIAHPDRLLGKYAWVRNIVGGFSHREVLIGLGLILIGVFCVKVVARYFLQKRMLRFVYDCRTKLLSDLLHVYQRMPYHLHLARNSSSLIVNINTHTTDFTDGVLLQVLRSSVEVFVLVGLLILLAWINIWAVMIMMIYFMIILLSWDNVLKKRLFEYGRIMSKSEAGLISGVNHAIGALKEIRLLGREAYFHSEVVKNAEGMAFAGTNSRVLQSVQGYIFQVSLVMFVVGTIFVITATGEEPATSFAFMGVFGVAAMRILPSITQIAFSFTAVRSTLYAVDTLCEDLYRNNEYSGSHVELMSFDEIPKKYKDFEVLECRNLNYKYPERENFVLNDINIKIRRGESIGVIGKTGSGKTTLIDVLLGLLKPTTGAVYLDGTEISDQQNSKLLQMWQSNVIYIPQDMFLTDDTIRHNTAFGVPDREVDEVRLLESLKQAELLELLEKLPDGLDTIIGERGIRLSGGERQRIGIARSFYFGREVIVMDEATSALDNETEAEILKFINTFRAKRTLIIIAHRLSTTKNCDHIFRLHEGRVVAEGTYEDVVDNAMYADTPLKTEKSG